MYCKCTFYAIRERPSKDFEKKKFKYQLETSKITGRSQDEKISLGK